MTASLPGPERPQHRWGLLSQAERNAAYDNNAAVHNSSALIEARNVASAAYRSGRPTARLDVPYGSGDRMKFDLYPAGTAAPVLVFIHGGYWQRGSREVFACYAAGAVEAGFSVVLPSHSLAPAASLATIVGEIGQSLDWLAEHGGAHGCTGPVVLSGWSAGAHLAAMTLDHRSVVAGLAISGVYELGPIRDTALNTALRLTDDEVADLSPLRRPASPKPLAIAYGSAELPALVADARDFHAHRAAAHAPGPLIPIAGADHFTVLQELQHPGGQLVRAVRMLLEEAT